MARKFLALALIAWSFAASAVTIDAPLADPVREAEAQMLFHELKCVVCEGQSLAESDAALALQMRGRIRALLAEGTSREHVITYFRERYGDRIVLRPPLDTHTVMLWIAPLVLLLVGSLLLRRYVRGARGQNHG